MDVTNDGSLLLFSSHIYLFSNLLIAPLAQVNWFQFLFAFLHSSFLPFLVYLPSKCYTALRPPVPPTEKTNHFSMIHKLYQCSVIDIVGAGVLGLPFFLKQTDWIMSLLPWLHLPAIARCSWTTLATQA